MQHYIELSNSQIAEIISEGIHSERNRQIDEVRQHDGEPPAGMLAVYEYEHRKQIDKAAKIKRMIAEYRG